MIKVGYGIFTWTGAERRSKRYGAFALTHRDYFSTVTMNPLMDVVATTNLINKRVKVVCKIAEARESGHAGDAFLNIVPSMPNVGDEIELGVGTLRHSEGDCGFEWALVPNDGRKELWIDPRKLYQLHDQTVEVYMEETTDDFSPKSTLTYGDTSGVIFNSDGTFQTLTELTPDLKLAPSKVTKLGRGLTEFHYDYKSGDRIRFV